MDYTPVELRAAVESRKTRSLDKYLFEYGKDVVGSGKDFEEPDDGQERDLIDHKHLVHWIHLDFDYSWLTSVCSKKFYYITCINCFNISNSQLSLSQALSIKNHKDKRIFIKQMKDKENSAIVMKFI